MESEVKLDFKKKRVITKKIGDQSFKIKPFISINEKEYILNTICNSIKERINANEDATPLILGIQADLDLLVCAICTNVDLKDINYEDIYNSEFLTIVKESIINYLDIEKSCFNLFYLFKVESMLPDLDNLNDKFDIQKLMEGKNKEEIEEFTKIIQDLNKSKE